MHSPPTSPPSMSSTPNAPPAFARSCASRPQQGLSVALSQYAPGKQVWISGKCYTSGAIYSVNPDDRFAAWQSKRIYMECDVCGFARTYSIAEARRHETRDCNACGGEQTFGPGRYWLRPPGFAHPLDAEEVTSPDDMPETSYATRAKLTMNTPDEDDAWSTINDRLRVLPSRKHLLVSNTGPRKRRIHVLHQVRTDSGNRRPFPRTPRQPPQALP